MIVEIVVVCGTAVVLGALAVGDAIHKREVAYERECGSSRWSHLRKLERAYALAISSDKGEHDANDLAWAQTLDEARERSSRAC
jgi:hypothetical protein